LQRTQARRKTRRAIGPDSTYVALRQTKIAGTSAAHGAVGLRVSGSYLTKPKINVEAQSIPAIDKTIAKIASRQILGSPRRATRSATTDTGIDPKTNGKKKKVAAESANAISTNGSDASLLADVE